MYIIIFNLIFSMVSYLLKVLALAIFSFIIIYFYYFTNSAHIENFNGYWIYVLIVWVIYAVYKFFQFELSDKKASFSLLKVLGFFSLHLFILCVLFFHFNGDSLGSWIVLYFKILYFSFIPVSIVLISLAFWKKLIWYLPGIESETSIYKFLLSIWIWFFSFVFLLDIFWILGFYNIWIVFAILIWFIVFSYKELIAVFKWIVDYSFEIDIEEWNYLKLISTEFLFLVSTLVLSISLISIVRPFPIWWDDLWAYMNMPHLMAEAGSIIALGQMYAWQTFTGIGYMFGSPTQAFFLNNVWWFLSFIALVLITSDLLKSTWNKWEKTFINIPLLVWTIFISLPMVVFQQAKDMKLDPGLFFVSIISLYLLYKYYLKESNTLERKHSLLENTKDKIVASFSSKGEGIQGWGFLYIILIIWLLAWFAFSIKFTSLLLISAIIWVVTFARLWLVWFLWYIFIFFAIFTKADLWWKMNVVVNPGNIVWFETMFALVSLSIWFWLLVLSFINNKWIIKKFFIELWILLLWIFIALLPWLGKNISESYPNISVWTLISWSADRFDFDKSLIYSDEEIKIIDENKKRERISAEWIIDNEDFWRYFGYEKWVNNYLKLPWNLTMQVNQWGEFTDIWFLFLALLPAILLFLPFRKKYYAWIIVVALIFELLVFIKTDNNLIDNSSISSISSEAKQWIFISNTSVLKDKKYNKDIYDIKVANYITSNDISSLVTDTVTYEMVSERAVDLFYKELEAKVLDTSMWTEIVLTKWNLLDTDFEIIEELRILNSSYSRFNNSITSIVALEKSIELLNLDSEKEKLISIWKDNRTFNQYVSDFFSSFNLPLGYAIILFVFLLPVILFLYLLDTKTKTESSRVNLFKLNLVFASFYTFLWTISAFWVVWYWISMYFAFLLCIALWAYYLASYKEEDNDKTFYLKLFWSIVFSLIIIIYIVNSVLPHSFTNLKWAWYDKYKVWDVTVVNAPYLYHQEYLKILFHTNIDQSKTEEFIKEYVSDDIKEAVTWIEKMDIFTIRVLLNQIISQENILTNSAKRSLNNIYKNISNPSEEFKSSTWIYRIGTFLKYHISENNNRLLEDNLIFSFNDYIYDSNVNKTVENISKLWLWYLLVDLNAATIDKDSRHNLTTRYERLLNTFTSDRLELIETDSICLKVALDSFSRSEKMSEDRKIFMAIAWVNYESYTENWTQINRATKLLQCFDKVDELIKENKIDKDNYPYLLNIANYIWENKESFQTENQVYTLLQQQIRHWYKALFKVK